MLKVVIVTQDDPFYIPHFFDELSGIWSRDMIMEGVVIQEPLGDKSTRKLISRMYDFYGPIDFMRMGTRYVLLKSMTSLAAAPFSSYIPNRYSVREIATKKGWPILHLRDVNAAGFVRWIKKKKVDLILSVAASHIFRLSILSAPRYGCLNIHNSLLPKNRGMLPNFWALLNHDRDPLSGITIHKMNGTLDDGEIILQQPFRLNPDCSLHQLIIRTKRMSAHLAAKTLKMYLDGEPKGRHNSGESATYNTFPTKKDTRKFREKGLKLL